MAKTSTVTQGDIKVFLTRIVRDDVRQLRREMAMERINILKTVGVGNLENYLDEVEADFIGSTTSIKAPQAKTKKFKRLTKTKRNPKL
ncbi:hypothetical protein IQ269_19215 [Tychonema sp. LEGE 07199]|uniref:hypothetical protein n=1 Tax=unclassified Tychonema TaxID=2642144 RepID=UPI0018813C58|nr:MULTISPECIES: hypothetical protein [unclassified Tychonema]MBE9122868.1 hypothetical protein [Tychonema sp. LEGE 07199]MBE9134723.1 hypothetical protein [Tychonema sp. LEGE 07196]